MPTLTSVITPSSSAPLALLGGAPAFARPLHVGEPAVPDRQAFMRRVEGALDRGWLTNNGPLVRRFESRIAEYSGVRHAVAVCNGTLGLQILAHALGLSGEVIVPSLTFIATAHALTWQGIRPVFADVDPETHNLDPAAVEGAVTPRTSAILAVHLWGRPCDVDGLQAVARRNGVPLIFDAAHAFGCSRLGRRVGGFGAAEVFSFHATKALHCIEGGAVVTDDDELAEKLRLLRNFGFAGYDRVEAEGINGKLNEIAAAMGLTGLDRFTDSVAHNRRLHAGYLNGLADVAGVTPLRYDPAEEHNYQYAVVEIDAHAAGLGRDRFLRVLHAENVVARRYFHPGCHRMAPYRDTDPQAAERLPVTSRLTERLLCLPTGPRLDADDVEGICGILRRAVEQAAAIRQLDEPGDG